MQSFLYAADTPDLQITVMEVISHLKICLEKNVRVQTTAQLSSYESLLCLKQTTNYHKRRFKVKLLSLKQLKSLSKVSDHLVGNSDYVLIYWLSFLGYHFSLATLFCQGLLEPSLFSFFRNKPSTNQRTQRTACDFHNMDNNALEKLHVGKNLIM